MKKFTYLNEEATSRADKFLADSLPDYSRAALHRLFEAGLVLQAGKPIKAGERLRAGAVLEVDLSPLDQKPDVIDLPVIYEDADVIVVDKPAGVISHARGRFWQEASVASFVRAKVSADLGGDRAGIVHRLDRATSGVMICAKNEVALKFLQRQFQDRKVTKSYTALTEKAPKHTEAVIDAPIARDNNRPKQFRVDPHGKNALTHYRISETKTGLYMWELTPETGRTHQLRVHLKYLNCPIIGDELYDGKAASRLYLHARSLKIAIRPGEERVFESSLPDGFENGQ